MHSRAKHDIEQPSLQALLAEIVPTGHAGMFRKVRTSWAHLAERAGLLERGPARDAGEAEDMHAGDDHRFVPEVEYLPQACGQTRPT